MEADINEKSCTDLVVEYNPPDCGLASKKLNVEPRKPSFHGQQHTLLFNSKGPT
jgi:hypothetical protein